jgi:ABC-type cobalamin transport system permease subunit
VTPSERRHFAAAFFGGVSGALLGMVLFTGFVAPTLVAVLGSAVLPYLLERRALADTRGP